MLQEININMGEMLVGSGPISVKTGGIGSCVVIILYDDEKKLGGIAHAMLPSRKDKQSENVVENGAGFLVIRNKYVDEAIEILIEEIKKIGGNKKNLIAKLIGGAQMFKTLGVGKFGIGYQNLEMAHEQLKKLAIPIGGEEIGGTVGRLVEFNLENGLVDVSTKM